MSYPKLSLWVKFCLRVLLGGLLAIPVLTIQVPDPFHWNIDWVHVGMMVILVSLSIGLALNYRWQSVTSVYFMLQLEVLALWLGFLLVFHFGIVLFEPPQFAASTPVSFTEQAVSTFAAAFVIALIDCAILASANGIRRLTHA